jgi:hypothetical protein
MWRHWHWLVLRRSPGGIRVLNTTAAATTGLFTTDMPRLLNTSEQATTRLLTTGNIFFLML